MDSSEGTTSRITDETARNKLPKVIGTFVPRFSDLSFLSRLISTRNPREVRKRRARPRAGSVDFESQVAKAGETDPFSLGFSRFLIRAGRKSKTRFL
jgi:hypothetical protein